MVAATSLRGLSAWGIAARGTQILLTAQRNATRGKSAMPSERACAGAGHTTAHGLRNGVIKTTH
eukprot:5600958-Lingulodinium_polyedra.AAC.1